MDIRNHITSYNTSSTTVLHVYILVNLRRSINSLFFLSLFFLGSCNILRSKNGDVEQKIRDVRKTNDTMNYASFGTTLFVFPYIWILWYIKDHQKSLESVGTRAFDENVMDLSMMHTKLQN